MDIRVAMYIATIASLYVNIALCIYGVISKPNLIKKFIALTILQDSINVFLILGGYRLWRPGLLLQPPVLLNWSPTDEDLKQFLMRSVDPLPQALVLTAIVIGLAVNTFLAIMIIHLYRHFSTIDVDEIGSMKKVMIVEESA
ncbi:MAG: sodium:proton antiporter [Ignisphaera sp.]|uniref:Na+/H+ antiporter subunit C n=1 Tax=Ignisphaera aggregans TaxID=334771 RepID=A0A7C4D0C8_9CREN